MKRQYLSLKNAKRLITSVKNLISRRFSLPLTIHQFTFEVTRRCSGRCLYCSIWETKNHDEVTSEEVSNGLKPRELFKNVEAIGITGGEPFLRDDLVDLCQTLLEICPKADLGLVTNGLHPKRVLKAMEEIRSFHPSIHICVSIDGFAYSDGVLRGNPKHSELAWETVELLKEQRFPVTIGSVVTSVNIDEIFKFKRFCSLRNVPHGIMTANISEHFYDNAEKSSMKRLAIPEEKYPLFETICHRSPSFTHHFLAKYLQEQRQLIPCFSVFSSFFLSSNGTIYPCIHLDKPMGNIRAKPFGEFWNDQNARKIRQKVLKAKCHCFTQCEVSGSLRANIYPEIFDKLRRGLKIAP